MERVSTAGLNAKLLNQALQVQSRYVQKEVESASGLTAETYGAMGASGAQRLIGLEGSLKLSEAWGKNATLANTRIQAMYTAVGTMADLLTSLRSTISAAMSGNSDATLNSEGQSALEDLAAQMNLQQEGRYLFAGNATDSAPVTVTDPPYAAPAKPSAADTSYYSGTSDKASVKIGQGLAVVYGVAADDTAFEKALRAANIVAHVTADPVDSDSLKEAYQLATEGLDGLLAIQGRLSVNSRRMETAIEQQDAYGSVLTSLASDLKSVDVAAITVEVSQYQAQLQASYNVVAQVMKVSLVDYLR